MDEVLNEPAAGDERQVPPPSLEKQLEAMYKKVGITAVFAAANYVKQSKPRRVA